MGASVILSVPCCQHEWNREMESEALASVLQYGIVRERMAALFTDAFRANLLEACGYKTQLLEFIDMEHTPKNILIRGMKKETPSEEAKARRIGEIGKEIKENFGLTPTLYRLLMETE